MDFEWSSEQRQYRDRVITWARRELNDHVLRRDAEQEFSHDGWGRCAEFGIQGLPVPREYGGQGADALTIAFGLEALGYACRDNGLLFSLNAQMWSCEMPIVTFGTEKQKERYLPGLCDGSLIGVQGITEEGSGSDALSLATVAERRGDRYVLNGSKTFVANAPMADVFVIFASLDRDRGFAGISAFLVDRDAPGLTVGSPFAKMGLRTSPASELTFADVEVPADALLGLPGGGMAVFNAAMEWERSLILASALGTMQHLLDRCVDHARNRRQFGQPIGRFQSVANRIVDMKVRLETSRLLVYQVAWLKGNGRSAGLESAMAKLHVSECYLQSSLDAVQIHGGSGYLSESELEREVRDAVGSRIYSGTSEMQRNIIARRLRL